MGAHPERKAGRRRKWGPSQSVQDPSRMICMMLTLNNNVRHVAPPVNSRQAGEASGSPPQRSPPQANGGISAHLAQPGEEPRERKATGLKENIYKDERQKTSLKIEQWNFSLSTREKRTKLQTKDHTLDDKNSPSYLEVAFDPRLTWKNQVEQCQRTVLIKKLTGLNWGAHHSIIYSNKQSSFGSEQSITGSENTCTPSSRLERHSSASVDRGPNQLNISYRPVQTYISHPQTFILALTEKLYGTGWNVTLTLKAMSQTRLTQGEEPDQYD
ncbi:hypothetical protein PoB_005007400 [Plakobranchus ocellatus]|uniref:Uncharacterized protein n=1 Tax=Plakobranchus ocellatus TaxID=259542 RepID=A0AAV4BTQ7_9GAST|nr:hypothetical protein PoB_005007400 [Plakobranchus ocellatus]